MTLRLFPALAVLAATGVAATAAVAAPGVTPDKGTWRGETDGTTDALAFRLATAKRTIRASSIRVVTSAGCEDPDQPSGPVAARRLRIRIPAIELKRGKRPLWSRSFTARRRRSLSGGARIQMVKVAVLFVGRRRARAAVTVRDDVTTTPRLSCTSSFRLPLTPPN